MRSTACNFAALCYTKLLLILQVWRPVWFSNRRYGPGDTEGRRTDTISSAKASYHLVPLCLNFGSSVSNEWWLILCRLACLWCSCIWYSDHCRWIVGWWTNEGEQWCMIIYLYMYTWLSIYTCTRDFSSSSTHLVKSINVCVCLLMGCACLGFTTYLIPSTMIHSCYVRVVHGVDEWVGGSRPYTLAFLVGR